MALANVARQVTEGEGRYLFPNLRRQWWVQCALVLAWAQVLVVLFAERSMAFTYAGAAVAALFTLHRECSEEAKHRSLAWRYQPIFLFGALVTLVCSVAFVTGPRTEPVLLDLGTAVILGFEAALATVAAVQVFAVLGRKITAAGPHSDRGLQIFRSVNLAASALLTVVAALLAAAGRPAWMCLFALLLPAIPIAFLGYQKWLRANRRRWALGAQAAFAEGRYFVRERTAQDEDNLPHLGEEEARYVLLRVEEHAGYRDGAGEPLAYLSADEVAAMQEKSGRLPSAR